MRVLVRVFNSIASSRPIFEQDRLSSVGSSTPRSYITIAIVTMLLSPQLTQSVGLVSFPLARFGVQRATIKTRRDCTAT